MSRLGTAPTARGSARREGFATRGTQLRGATALIALAVMMAVVGVSAGRPAVARAAAPPGSGFTVTAGDLAFILKQIKIAEAHVANLSLIHI